MKQHFALVGQFTGVQQATANQQAAQATPTQSQCQVLLPDENERILSLQIAIKAADLANLCDPHHTHIKWVHMLEEEVSEVRVSCIFRRPCSLATSLTDRSVASCSHSSSRKVTKNELRGCPSPRSSTAPSRVSASPRWRSWTWWRCRCFVRWCRASQERNRC
jgi:hypothetical protein